MVCLLTRPIEQSLELASLLKKRGIESFIEPMIEIVPNDLNIYQYFTCQRQFFIITSKNSLQTFMNPLINQNIQLLVIGNDTASYAKEMGFSKIITAQPNVNDLMAFIQNNLNENYEIIYPRSDYVSRDLSEFFLQKNIKFTEIIVYQTLAKKSLSKSLIEMITANKISVILFFSRRTAEIFLRLISNIEISKHLSAIKIFAISQNVARILRHQEWQQISVAKIPNTKGIIELFYDN